MDVKTALKIIRKYCKNKENCKNCQFNGKPKESTSFHCKLDSTPKHWNIKDIDI